MPQDRKFILKQTAALLKLGISPQDIERTIAWVDKRLPEGEDAATWIPTAADLSDDLISEAAVADARASWYADKSVPRRFKRILDSRSEA